MKKNRVENFIWIVFCVIGSIFFIIGLSICINIFNTENRIQTQGTITQIETYRDSEGVISHSVFVSYNVEGKEYETRLNGYVDSFYEGKEIEIYYDKNNPRKIGANSLDIVTLIFPVFGLIFFSIGLIGIIFNINKKKKEKYLKENGDQIYAKYIETIVNVNYAVNGRHPYNIICEWENPSDNKKYIFRSGNIWINPENIINEKNIKMFPVYIKRDDIKEYAVDIQQIEEYVVDLT